jgi:hypothetical protein
MVSKGCSLTVTASFPDLRLIITQMRDQFEPFGQQIRLTSLLLSAIIEQKFKKDQLGE